MKNKQTATEYFYDRVISIFTKYHEEDVPTIDFGKLITEAFDTAKEMEKVQIVDTYNKAVALTGKVKKEYQPNNTTTKPMENKFAVRWLIEQINKKIDLTKLENWNEIESLVWASEQMEMDLFSEKFNSIIESYYEKYEQ
jgi:hypothetical protein